jgi:hypothetical protein
MSTPSSNSADLNQLISSLYVTRTNCARVREQGGQEETEGSNAGGTSSHSLTCVGTGLGQPYTVNSFQGPQRSTSVEVQEQQYSSASGMPRNRLKYKLCLIPAAPTEFATICGRVIGQGHFICIVPNCSGVSHQGDGTSTMLQGGLLMVLKNPTSVFAEPRMRSDLLTPSLLHVWLEEHVALDAWAERVRLAKSTVRPTKDQQDPNLPPQERVSAAMYSGS